jgi:hypothetical protein
MAFTRHWSKISRPGSFFAGVRADVLLPCDPLGLEQLVDRVVRQRLDHLVRVRVLDQHRRGRVLAQHLAQRLVLAAEPVLLVQVAIALELVAVRVRHDLFRLAPAITFWPLASAALRSRSTCATFLPSKHFGSVHVSAFFTSSKRSLFAPVRFGQALQLPALATRLSSLMSNGASDSRSM